MSEATQAELKEALLAVREARKEITAMEEKGMAGLSELQEKFEKANEVLDKHEELNQKMVNEKAAQKKAMEEAEERIKELEVKAAQFSTMNMESKGDMQVKQEMKALGDFVVGKKVEEKYLRTDSGEEGGFLVRDGYDDMIHKPITEISPLRNWARTKRVNGKAMNLATRSTLTTTYSTHQEGVTPWTASNSTYKQPKIPVHSITTLTEMTTLAEKDNSWFDLENELMQDMVESRAQFEGNLFVNGTGVNQAKGFLNGAETANGLAATASGSASTFDYQDLITITGELKTGYNPVYGFNRKTLAFIRSLEDGGGRPIWIPGNTAAGIDSQLNGYSYVEIPDMPDVGANAYPVVFADFSKLYTIVDAFTANFLRNPYKNNGFIEISMESWVGGQNVLTEAGHLLQCAAS